MPQLHLLTIFSLIACCPTLNILLENDAKNEVSYLEGVYTFQGFSNGMDYWVDADGENAIWYYPEFKEWAIGNINNLGTNWRSITCVNNLDLMLDTI